MAAADAMQHPLNEVLPIICRPTLIPLWRATALSVRRKLESAGPAGRDRHRVFPPARSRYSSRKFLAHATTAASAHRPWAIVHWLAVIARRAWSTASSV